MLQNGRTALFDAGNAEVVKMLVDYGAVVDIKDKVLACVAIVL